MANMKNNNVSEQQIEELKDAVKQALANYDSEAVIQMLIQQGYDPFYAQSIVEEAEQEEGSVIPSSEQTEDTSSEDAMLEQQAQAQQEEDDLEAARQQMLAEQQQMADEDMAADDYQDYEEDQYFNFAAGGTQMGQYGMDIEPMPNAQYSQGIEQPYVTWPTMEGDLMRDGGIPNKRSFLKKMTKHLMKANEGMEQSSKIPSPYGNVDNPTGNDLSGKNNFISALNKQTQMFQAKQQAEQMYNNMYSKNVGGDMTQYGPPADLHDPLEHLHQYGEALNHELPLDTSIETMQFGGFKNRRIKRANRALFGVPFAIPGVNTTYEFGPLGSLRRATADWDVQALGNLVNFLPGGMNILPGMTTSGWKSVIYPAQVRKKVIETVNNKALDEVAGNTPGSDATQNSEVKGAPLQSEQETANDIWKYYAAGVGQPFSVDPSQNANPFKTKAYSDWMNYISPPGSTEHEPYAKKSGKKDNLNTDYVDESHVWSSPISSNVFNKTFEKLTDIINNKSDEEVANFWDQNENILENDSYITKDDEGNEYSTKGFYTDVRPNPKAAELGHKWNFARENMLGKVDDDWVRKYASVLANPYAYGGNVSEPMQFGGFKNRRIKRVNRALFGVPFTLPGAEVDYQFGPLGGLRRASANIDIAALAELFKMLPGSPNANPLVTFNDALKEITYQYEGELVDDPATIINKQTIKEVADKTNNETAKKASSETPIVKSSVIPKSSPVKSTKVSPSKKDAWGRPEGDPWYNFDPVAKKFKNSTTTNQSGLPNIGKADKQHEQPKLRSNRSMGIWDTIKLIGKLTNPGVFNHMFDEGGFVDTQNPNLYKFNYGGDDISIPYINDTDMYRKGGRILPQAQPGMSSFDLFRLQKMNPDGTLKNKPFLPSAEELMGNPYIQPQRLAVAPSPSPAPNQQQGQQMSPQQMQMLQQYMQMMQQQGMPFAYGAPRGLGRAALRGLTGLSRDFNYFTGDNPGNWNIPEGYTNLRKETFKDRGQWYNPFDTKRVTTYEYSKPGEPAAPGAPTAPNAEPTVENAPGYNPTAAGPGYSGYNADSDGNNIPDYLQAEGPGQMPGTQVQEVTTESKNPYRSNVKGLEDESRVSIRAGERAARRNERRAMRQDSNAFYEGEPLPGMITPMSNADYMPKVEANRPGDNFLPTAPRVGTGTGMSSIFGGLEGPGVNTPPVSNPLIQPNLMNQPLYKPGSGSGSGIYNVGKEFEYGGYMDEGGFIPDYYTFDGYLPMAAPGIISDTEDFQNIQDPNAIKYRIEEQSGWSWDPAQLGNTSSLLKNATSNQFENMASLQRQRAGSNKINYASDINRQPVNRGLTDQEGVEKNVGFESGRTYMGKYGGQYKHGGTYSLTREQIDQIRKMGGDVEFI